MFKRVFAAVSEGLGVTLSILFPSGILGTRPRQLVTGSSGNYRQPFDRELPDSFVEMAYACACINAASVAGTPLRLYSVSGRVPRGASAVPLSREDRARLFKVVSGRRLGRAAKVISKLNPRKLVEIVDHELLTLLGRPNELMDGYSHVEITQLFLEIVGRAAWFVDDVAGGGRSIWIIDPLRVKPDIRDKNELVRYLISDNAGGTDEVEPEQMLMFRMPSVRDPYFSGVSPLAAGSMSAGLLRDDLTQARSILSNLARPDMWISPKTPDDSLTDSEAKRLVDKIDKALKRGPGGVIVSESALEAKQLTWSQRDMEATPRAKFQVERLANIFGVPVPFLFASTNLANLQAALKLHAMMTVVPRLTRLVNTINSSRLISSAGDGLFLWYDDPVPDDLLARARVVQTRLTSGELTINEVRRDSGYEPVPWGDKPWLNMSLIQPSDDEEMNQRSPRTTARVPSPGNAPADAGEPAREQRPDMVMDAVSIPLILSAPAALVVGDESIDSLAEYEMSVHDVIDAIVATLVMGWGTSPVSSDLGAAGLDRRIVDAVSKSLVVVASTAVEKTALRLSMSKNIDVSDVRARAMVPVAAMASHVAVRLGVTLAAWLSERVASRGGDDSSWSETIGSVIYDFLGSGIVRRLAIHEVMTVKNRATIICGEISGVAPEWRIVLAEGASTACHLVSKSCGGVIMAGRSVCKLSSILGPRARVCSLYDEIWAPPFVPGCSCYIVNKRTE